MRIQTDSAKVVTKMIAATLLMVSTGLAVAALPAHNDPDLEISRIRCQIQRSSAKTQ